MDNAINIMDLGGEKEKQKRKQRATICKLILITNQSELFKQTKFNCKWGV